ncbi:MAG: N-acetyltransferase [Clostridiales Family XIII bacterium]|jgi:predicted GNAT family acetyltransferase|nr:N-acetyltransferase [Clostridiales Family XIII bacterium]
MEFTKDSNCIYTVDDNGAVIAKITFPNTEDGTVLIDHTFVDPALRGQGVAAQLAGAAYDVIKAAGKKADVICPYAIKWFDEHPEKRDILIEK